MKRIVGIFWLFAASILMQCTSAHEKELKELDTQLIKGHDEVMPKSMKLGDLKKQVLDKAAAADTTRRARATQIANQLQAAEDAMYTWMDDYSKAINDIKDEQQRLDAYKKLKTEIEQIKTDTDRAIQTAKSF